MMPNDTFKVFKEKEVIIEKDGGKTVEGTFKGIKGNYVMIVRGEYDLNKELHFINIDKIASVIYKNDTLPVIK